LLLKQQQTVAWINEFHYDNTGADVGEFVEIETTTIPSSPFNPSGTSFTVIDYATNGIQNGAPDGIALVSASGVVVEYFSYEGAFIASTGPAAGLLLAIIGVAELGSDPVGWSLQRCQDTRA
jgi:hypothetical protein